MQKKNILIITACIIVAFTISVLIINKPADATTNNLPQEYMYNVAITKFNASGNIQQKINASKWQYFANLKQSILEAPKLVVFKDNGSVWHLHSNFGNATQKSLSERPKYILLTENVVMQRLKAPNITPVKFNTSKAYFYPKDELVTSDNKVTMEKPGIIVEGTGLRSYMDKQYAEILKDVKVKYVNSKKSK